MLHALHCIRPDAASQNRLRGSTVGSTLQCVRSRAQPGALGTVQWTSQSGAWDFRVAGLRCLVLVLKQDAHLRTPNPLLSGHLQPCTLCLSPKLGSPASPLRNHKEEAIPCFLHFRSEGVVQESQRGDGPMWRSLSGIVLSRSSLLLGDDTSILTSGLSHLLHSRIPRFQGCWGHSHVLQLSTSSVCTSAYA